MTIQQILDLLAQVQAQLVALQAAQATFSQADIDAAVKAAVDPLTAQLVALNAQVAAMPDQIHQAVVAEDALVAQRVKPAIDQLAAQILALIAPQG